MQNRKKRAYLGFIYNENAHIIDMSEIFGYHGDCLAAVKKLSKKHKVVTFACINHFEGGSTALKWYRFQNSRFARCTQSEFREFARSTGKL